MAVVVLGRVHSLPEDWTLLPEVTPTQIPSANSWFPCGGGLTAVPPMHCPALVNRSWPRHRTVSNSKSKNNFSHVSKTRVTIHLFTIFSLVDQMTITKRRLKSHIILPAPALFRCTCMKIKTKTILVSTSFYLLFFPLDYHNVVWSTTSLLQSYP